MSHVDDGTLHELIDDALDTNDRVAVEAHLASCGECAKRFAEATAMARQVHTLLGALDAVPAPVRIVASIPARAAVSTPVRNAALAAVNVTPVQRHLRMIRRVALAASALLVAGISYRAGVSRTTGDAQAARKSARESASAPTVARLGAQPEAMQAVTGSAPESASKSASKSAPKSAPRSAARSGPESPLIAVPSAPPERVASRRAVRAEDAVASGAATPPVEAIAAPIAAAIPAPLAASASAPISRRSAVAVDEMASPAASMPKAIQRIGSTLIGFQMREDVTLPSVTRRRYIAADGTMLDLLITPTIADAPKQGTNAVLAFTVSTADGRSTVRWQRSGMSYELQGALAPDSLVKLATQLR